MVGRFTQSWTFFNSRQPEKNTERAAFSAESMHRHAAGICSVNMQLWQGIFLKKSEHSSCGGCLLDSWNYIFVITERVKYQKRYRCVPNVQMWTVPNPECQFRWSVVFVWHRLWVLNSGCWSVFPALHPRFPASDLTLTRGSLWPPKQTITTHFDLNPVSPSLFFSQEHHVLLSFLLPLPSLNSFSPLLISLHLHCLVLK